MSDEPEQDGEPGGEGVLPPRAGVVVTPDLLARELGGDLPCARCRYNLRGLSVRSVCPECGTPVRATILARVDPYASVLRPIRWPRLTGAGLLLWSFGALAAALCVWCLRLTDVLDEVADLSVNLRAGARIGTVCIGLSAVGALALVRPHAGIRLRQRLAAMLGVAATAASAWVYWCLLARFDANHAPPYITGDWVSAERIGLRLEFGALLVVALLGLRPNARLLAGRSLLVRMGHVDHQAMLAMVAAAGLGMIGDALELAGPHARGIVALVAGGVGTALIAVSSMLLTVGLVGVALDCVRLAPVVLRPPLSIGKVMGGADRGGAAAGGV